MKEAAVLSRLPEEKLRREVERAVIEPEAVVVGSAHRLRFGEPDILYFAMLHSLVGRSRFAVKPFPLFLGITAAVLVVSLPASTRGRTYRPG